MIVFLPFPVRFSLLFFQPRISRFYRLLCFLLLLLDLGATDIHLLLLLLERSILFSCGSE